MPSLEMFFVSVEMIRKTNEQLILIAEDSAFLEAALRYPEDVFVASEALRFTPSILAPYFTTSPAETVSVEADMS